MSSTTICKYFKVESRFSLELRQHLKSPSFRPDFTRDSDLSKKSFKKNLFHA